MTNALKEMTWLFVKNIMRGIISGYLIYLYKTLSFIEIFVNSLFNKWRFIYIEKNVITKKYQGMTFLFVYYFECILLNKNNNFFINHDLGQDTFSVR